MDLLDRLLGHDYDTTRELLLICQNLSDEDMNKDFDIGWRTLRQTLDHMISNIEVWTALMMGNAISYQEASSNETLLARLDQAYAEFSAFAKEIQHNNRLDEFWVDHLDEPPLKKTYGGAILHVITHNLHHRAEVMHILHRLNVESVPEGDLVGWDVRRHQK